MTNCISAFNVLWRQQLTEGQERHLQLMDRLQQLNREEDSIRQQLRNSWLTLTSAEKANLLPPPVPLVRQ